MHLLAQSHSGRLHVFATARNEQALADLTVIGIEALSLEVKSPNHVAKIIEYVYEHTGGSLDYLVNNAGRNYTVPALDIDFAEVQGVIEFNVFAVMVVNVGGVAARVPYVLGSFYNASEAALQCHRDTLRGELAPFEVKVIVVVTRGVKSNICRIHRELSKVSLYLPLDAEYKRRQLYPQEVGEGIALYAAKVVEAVLKSHPATPVWKGTRASNVWLLLTVFPRMFWDHYFAILFNMGKLARLAKGQQNSD